MAMLQNSTMSPPPTGRQAEARFLQKWKAGRKVLQRGPAKQSQRHGEEDGKACTQQQGMIEWWVSLPAGVATACPVPSPQRRIQGRWHVSLPMGVG